LFQLLDGWVRDFGVVFNNEVFIFGPKYVASDRREKKMVINFVVGGAKMAIMVNTEMESERRGGSRY